jgi:hypothetical protein
MPHIQAWENAMTQTRPENQQQFHEVAGQFGQMR